MKPRWKSTWTWWTVVLFALAMAWMESATVVYLRRLVGRVEPYQADPFPPGHGLERIELVREFATLLMLATVGTLAGRKWIQRLGYAAIAFGVWDIFYYVFLRIMCGWPRGLLDWDVLFLLPLPWWGPVLAPVSISLLMIWWGTMVNSCRVSSARTSPTVKASAIALIGISLALYVFMRDALQVLDQGQAAVRQALPTAFPWPLFLLALLAMAAPALELCRRTWPFLGDRQAKAPELINVGLAKDRQPSHRPEEAGQ